MIYYAVIDTNVVVSSMLKETSIPGKAIDNVISGNIKHFPVKPFVVTPKEMLEIILEDGATPE